MRLLLLLFVISFSVQSVSSFSLLPCSKCTGHPTKEFARRLAGEKKLSCSNEGSKEARHVLLYY